MLSLIPKPNPRPNDIRTLRSYSTASIAEIRKAAQAGASIRDFQIFEGDWEGERAVIGRLYGELVSNRSAPFVLQEDGVVFDTAEDFKEWLDEVRRIELQTQRDTDLEMGFIGAREEFVPHDEPWF